MANDCWNKIIIKGDETQLMKIEEKFNSSENGVFTINNYHLLFDTDVSDMSEEDFGSKRFIPSVSRQDGQLLISGESAWSPMIGLFERICHDYKVEATLNYDEQGLDFAGRISWDSNGVETENEEWTYWENLYLTNTVDFWEEITWRFEDYDTLGELLEILEFDRWRQTTQFDHETLERLFEEYIDQNS